MLSGGTMRRLFKDSLKVLEADIQHARTLYIVVFPPNLVLLQVNWASGFPIESDGACLQMLNPVLKKIYLDFGFDLVSSLYSSAREAFSQ
ncbi:hypothetical protein ZIOFF_015612 [Zingiber officinale]|uniref:Uncharacterized protein n=1 Tax=Zingiber officinale TaxID=94328 RepID=A0A8J5LMK4_ZINOF|nr:hypothetical protein ZIOFF_015612 [Zingiber officinale]